ncbi:MAG TPA: hypothetical protein VFD43_10465, partial [Planctomycetota bacterium]|nr:hypothetical protein [Planctomycetota bacterium]
MRTRRGRFAALLAGVVLALAAGRPSAQDLAQQQQDLAQKTWALVNLHLEQARALEEQFNLAGAEKELLAARDVDPGNRLVAEYLAEIQSLQALPPEQARAAAMTAADRAEAQADSLRLEAVSDLAAAKRLLASGRTESAARAAQQVVDRIGWTRGSVDWGDIEPAARELLAACAAG